MWGIGELMDRKSSSGEIVFVGDNEWCVLMCTFGVLSC